MGCNLQLDYLNHNIADSQQASRPMKLDESCQGLQHLVKETEHLRVGDRNSSGYMNVITNFIYFKFFLHSSLHKH